MNKASVLLAASAAALALTAAGCGGSGDPKSSSSGTNAAADQGVKHAQCMRENGVPNFPDPDQNGGGTTNRPDRDSPQFKKAQQECKALERPEKQPGTPQYAEAQQKMLKYAQCMRKNGVPNFPDPQGGYIRAKKGSIDSSSSQFKKAVDACRSLAVGRTGTGG